MRALQFSRRPKVGISDLFLTPLALFPFSSTSNLVNQLRPIKYNYELLLPFQSHCHCLEYVHKLSSLGSCNSQPTGTPVSSLLNGCCCLCSSFKYQCFGSFVVYALTVLFCHFLPGQLIYLCGFKCP